MRPHWNNFNGIIKKIDKHSYEVYGSHEFINNKVIITELPVGMWTSTYKEIIEKQLDDETIKKEKNLLNYKDNNTDKSVHFELEFNKDAIDDMDTSSFEKDYHMVKKVSLNNMHLYSTSGKIKKYNSIKSIMEEYFDYRLELYQKRKDYILNKLKETLDLLGHKVKFILMVINEELIINNRKKKDIEQDLITHEFPKIGNDYGYLLNMPLYSLTFEKIEDLKKQMDEKQSEYDNLDNVLPKDMWKNELQKLLVFYNKWVKDTV
jgi:DNA topoisomerase-2